MLIATKRRQRGQAPLEEQSVCVEREIENIWDKSWTPTPKQPDTNSAMTAIASPALFLVCTDINVYCDLLLASSSLSHESCTTTLHILPCFSVSQTSRPGQSHDIFALVFQNGHSKAKMFMVCCCAYDTSGDKIETQFIKRRNIVQAVRFTIKLNTTIIGLHRWRSRVTATMSRVTEILGACRDGLGAQEQLLTTPHVVRLFAATGGKTWNLTQRPDDKYLRAWFGLDRVHALADSQRDAPSLHPRDDDVP